MNGRKIGLLLALALTALPAAAGGRAIAVDMADIKGPRDMFWQECVGSGHAALLLRPANQEQLRFVHAQAGFKTIRFHGIFSDHMGVYREIEGKPVYDFSKVDTVYDAILKTGMKPFIEIGPMPDALAIHHKPIFYWKYNGSPPKDYGKWGDLVAAFAQHLIDRYGKAEVESWRFEVWNEPNLDGFWNGASQPEYFRLYDATARALARIDAELKVGGPATAGAAWVPEFLDRAGRAMVRIDFVATHAYGVDGGFLDEFGQDDNKLSPNPDAVSADVRKVRREIEESRLPGLPLHFTEWNSSYNPRDPVHDSYINAAFVLDKLKTSEGYLQSMSYWAYSDLFEEPGPPPTPFHGGFGLVTREGIPKSTFFAYKYLNALGPKELRGADARSWLTRDGDDFAALIWDFTLPDQKESNRPYFRKNHPPASLEPVALTIKNLRPGRYKLTLHRTGFRANDAYARYIDWGLPDDLTEAQLAELKGLSLDAPERERIVTIGADRSFATLIRMRTNDVVLATLKRL